MWIERHLLVAFGTFETVVLPLEGDPLVVEGDEAAVGDGNAMRVAREIAQDFLRPPERRLGVDHPPCCCAAARRAPAA